MVPPHGKSESSMQKTIDAKHRKEKSRQKGQSSGSSFEGKDRIGETDWGKDDRLRSKEVDRDPRGGAAGG